MVTDSLLLARVLGLLLCVRLCCGIGELRLADGGSRCAGRVEVKHEGQWGSVCSYDFDWGVPAASVVCRQLGCGTVARASPYTPFGAGAGRIWLHPFFCRGTETALHSCPHFGWGKHFCDHKTDVGVICSDAVQLRLVNGAGPCEGRVEVKLRGQWGTVSDNAWDMDDAEVVCQQLGCGSAKSAHNSARFGKGSGLINMALVDCHGDESALWECTIPGWGPYKGPHDWDVGVICQGFVQLVGEDGTCSGRVEVRQGREWATFCETHMDLSAANVICKELGCGAALAVTSAAHFGSGAGPIWDGGFECVGNESLLSACTRRLPYGQGCSHANDTGIICTPYTDFRLVNGSTTCAGRVEMEVQGTWHSLCDTDWDERDAQVLCHQLGCGFVTSVPRGGYYGSGSSPLWQNTFKCSGIESHLGACPATALGIPMCSPGNTAAVNCSGQNSAEPLRLVGGESRCDGRVEVALHGVWGRVLAEHWDTSSANVVCRQLRCGEAQKAHVAPVPGPASSPVRLNGLRCVGTEDRLDQCNTTVPSATAVCHSQDVAVVCLESRHVRLVSGPGRCAGRVEIYVQGAWSSICEDNWDLQDATVVCRQLGCGRALAVPHSAHYGQGSGPVWLGAGGCVGTEASLWHCPVPAPAGDSCRQGSGAAVICSELTDLRLVGDSRCAGHLEVFYNGTWGSVCANGTSADTATVVCRQLGCGAGGQLVPAPENTQGSGPAWLSWVNCAPGTDSLWHCPSAPWHLQTCDTAGDTHVTCDEKTGSRTGPPTPATATICPNGIACTAAPSRLTAAPGAMPVPTMLCIVLATLLCLAVGALAVQAWRAIALRRGPGTDAHATYEAVYEELDYTVTPEYQEMPSGSGSPSERSATRLPYYTSNSVEGGSTRTAPENTAVTREDTLDGYDDADSVLDLRESAAPGLSDRALCETVALGEGRRPSLKPTDPPGNATDALSSIPRDAGYDDVDVSSPSTLL